MRIRIIRVTRVVGVITALGTLRWTLALKLDLAPNHLPNNANYLSSAVVCNLLNNNPEPPIERRSTPLLDSILGDIAAVFSGEFI